LNVINTNAKINVQISPHPSLPKRGIKRVSPLEKGGLRGI
jgi:hypothetical protein